MFFSAPDEDDGSGFSMGMPTSGSKLSSLFSMDAQSGGGNESLKYTAPKQPKPKGEGVKQDQNKDAPALLYACACHTYKYVNGQYVKQGKLGAAVLGHLATKDYKILLYMSQKKTVTNARIHAAFKFTVQKNNYASFYDDQTQSWSLCFDTEDQLLEFSKWVCLARFNVQPNALITQDLNVVDDGQEIQKGDTAEIQYTGWLHDGNAFGKVFDSNRDTGKLFKFKVGKGKVIKGWDAGLIGMKKTSRRMLVIPPDLAYGPKEIKDRVPSNATLIFQVEVTRVKFANPQIDSDTISVVSMDNTAKEEPSMSKPENADVDVNDSDSRERLNTSESLKDRTKSISDQLSKTPENTKSKLLERMSKMGQSIIPANPGIPKSLSPDLADGTENTQPIPIERQKSNEHPQSSFKPDSPKPNLKPKPEPVPRPVQPPQPVAPQVDHSYTQPQQHYTSQHAFHPQMEHNPMYLPQQQQLSLYQSPQAMQAAAMLGFSAIPQANIQPQQQSGMSSNEMNLMMTDSRLKHAEVKTDLNRIVEKVDNMTLKLSIIENENKQLQQYHPSQQQQQHQQQQQQQQLFFNQAPEMEASILLQNITRIIKENEKLQTECEEKNKKIEKLNERMTDLLTKNQSFFERSNELLANQTDSMQTTAAQAMVKVSTLEQQNIKLDTELSSVKNQLLQAQTKLEMASRKEADFLVNIESLKQDMKQYKENADTDNAMSAEHEALVGDLKEKLKHEKKEHKQMRLRLEQLDEEHSELRLEKDSLSKTINELKKKRKDDKNKYDEELEETKLQHEEELKSVKQRYKKDAGSDTDKLQSEQASVEHTKKLEDEARSRDAKIVELKEENSKLSEEVKELKEANTNTSEETTHVLMGEIEMLKTSLSALNDANVKLKEEIIALQNNSDTTSQDETNAMIEKLKAECDVAYDKGIQDGRENVKTISNASYQRGFEEGKSMSKSTDDDKGVSEAEVTEKIKKVMNTVFFKLRSHFEAEETYAGKQVVAAILNTVKDVTLQLTSKTDEEDEESDEGDDSESEDEDEEEEEDEDEEEEEKEEEKGEEKEEDVTGFDEVDDETDAVVTAPDQNAAQVSHSPNDSDEEHYATDEGDSVAGLSPTHDEDDMKLKMKSKEREPLDDVTPTSDDVKSTSSGVKDVDNEVCSSIPLPSTDSFEGNEDKQENEDLTVEGEEDAAVESSDNVTLQTGDDSSVSGVSPSEDLSNEKKESDKHEKENETNTQKNVLEEVGLDSSLFGSTPESIPESSTEVTPEETKESLITEPRKETLKDESSLFFSSGDTTAKSESEITSAKEKKPSLFDEDDDEEDFFAKKTSSKTSAFDRSPPPLFEDDDDDTNWI